MIVNALLHLVGQFVPTRGDGNASILKTPQHGDGIADIEIILGLLGAALCPPGGFPDVLEAAQAKIFASEMAIRVTNDALQIFGAAGYSRARPLERMCRDARMFTIGGSTAQVLRTQVASRILGQRLPQTRDGYIKK